MLQWLTQTCQVSWAGLSPIFTEHTEYLSPSQSYLFLKSFPGSRKWSWNLALIVSLAIPFPFVDLWVLSHQSCFVFLSCAAWQALFLSLVSGCVLAPGYSPHSGISILPAWPYISGTDFPCSYVYLLEFTSSLTLSSWLRVFAGFDDFYSLSLKAYYPAIWWYSVTALLTCSTHTLWSSFPCLKLRSWVRIFKISFRSIV